MDAQHKYPSRPKYIWIFITQLKIDSTPKLPTQPLKLVGGLGGLLGFGYNCQVYLLALKRKWIGWNMSPEERAYSIGTKVFIVVYSNCLFEVFTFLDSNKN